MKYYAKPTCGGGAKTVCAVGAKVNFLINRPILRIEKKETMV